MTGCPSCEGTPPLAFSEASVVTVAAFCRLYGCTGGLAQFIFYVFNGFLLHFAPSEIAISHVT